MEARSPYQIIAALKQRERAFRIPAKWRIPEDILPREDVDSVEDFPRTSGFFTAEELAMTEATASEIVVKIAAREWTAVEVTKAVCKRAAVAQQLVNCLTEIFFEDALARAHELDVYMAKEGRPVGPLHGLPISLKDQFNLKGIDSTIGYASYAGLPSRTDCTLATVLRSAGAIFFAKTNVPATLMMGESVNHLFGRTLHPHNRRLSPGGSSGGEAALLSLGGSPLGVGTDIGGSIRHPASFSGLFALRPSHGRVPYFGATNTFLGEEAIRSCAGPMARCAEDVRLFMRALVRERPWEVDPQCVSMPWRTDQEKLPAKLCFGFAMGDGYVTPTPPLRRAMEIAKTKLLAAGHNVIDFVPHETREASIIILKMWTADGGEEFLRDTDCTGEPLHLAIEKTWGRASGIKPLTVFETRQLQHARSILAHSFLGRWQATAARSGTGRPMDGLLMPSSPAPAPKHGSDYFYNYGTLCPLLDLTTGVFPVTKVNPEKDVVPHGWEPVSDVDKQVMNYYARPENHVDAPVGLSLIGRRLDEEKVCAMLKLMEAVVGVDY